MTWQVQDVFIYQNEEQKYCYIEDIRQFVIDFYGKYGMEVFATETDCYRGYICEYIIKDEQLFWTKVSLSATDYKPINGAIPIGNEYDYFRRYFLGEIPFQYTGWPSLVRLDT